MMKEVNKFVILQDKNKYINNSGYSGPSPIGFKKIMKDVCSFQTCTYFKSLDYALWVSERVRNQKKKVHVNQKEHQLY